MGAADTVAGKTAAGVDFDTSANVLLRDTAGTAQLTAGTSGVTIPTLSTTTSVAATSARVGTNTSGTTSVIQGSLIKTPYTVNTAATDVFTISVPNASTCVSIIIYYSLSLVGVTSNAQRHGMTSIGIARVAGAAASATISGAGAANGGGSVDGAGAPTWSVATAGGAAATNTVTVSALWATGGNTANACQIAIAYQVLGSRGEVLTFAAA